MFLRIGFNTVWSTDGFVVGTRGRDDVLYRANGRTLIIGAERMAYAEPTGEGWISPAHSVINTPALRSGTSGMHQLACA